MDALGADRIPEPTTAGYFCRRFAEEDGDRFQDVFHDMRQQVWREQGDKRGTQAIATRLLVAEPRTEVRQAFHRTEDGPSRSFPSSRSEAPRPIA